MTLCRIINKKNIYMEYKKTEYLNSMTCSSKYSVLFVL